MATKIVQPLAEITPQLAMKRGLDVIGAMLLILIFLIPMIAISISIWALMGAPVLFRQTRPGRNGRQFNMLKFRTMKPGDGSDEDRLTSLGRFLRKLSLDELPQLFNVLVGEMSLVGPRPLLVQYLERYDSEQARRHDMQPGITGWAQVNGRNAISWEEKFALDCWYIDHWSLWLDLRILAMTVAKVFGGKGISAPNEATMPEFMGSMRERR